MTHYWTDNVHTTALTPRDYQVELLSAALEKNIIVCLGHNSSKEFIAQKLIHEKAHEIREATSSSIEIDKKKNTLYICSDGDSIYNLVLHLTDLRVINLNEPDIESNADWDTLLNDYHVIILSAKYAINAFICGYLDFNHINLIIIENCHLKNDHEHIDNLMNYYKGCEEVNRPILLGLAGPLHSAGCPPGRLAAELEYLEKSLESKAETASDIVTVLRYCTTPVEIILQCAPAPIECNITYFLRDLILTRVAFLKEHRFDPSEIYSDEYLEEIQSYPDPKLEPLNALNEFLDVLENLGPWCADRAALNLLLKIEKMKVKTKYERHFLLLCMISTTFVQIRAYCEFVFQKLSTEAERIEKYSTPKVRRLLEILRLFKKSNNLNSSNNVIGNSRCPNNTNNQSQSNDLNSASQKIIQELNSLDFHGLSGRIGKLQNTLLDSSKTSTNNNPPPVDSAIPPTNPVKTSLEKLILDHKSKFTSNRLSPSKQRQRLRQQQTNRQSHHPHQQRTRPNWHHQNDPDALCGLIFCNSKFIAKILYNLLSEMSRNTEDLNYLAVQFTVDRVADPLTETKEAEIEHRKQEEVLKRFRMHECNLLIGTSVLEEGIDLPKCNLVIRWDPPTTYRSYVQCKGRARASNAYHIIMVSPKPFTNHFSNEELPKQESLSNKSHRLICAPDINFQDKIHAQNKSKILTLEIGSSSVTDNLTITVTKDDSDCTKSLPKIDHLFIDDRGDKIVEIPIEQSTTDECDMLKRYNNFTCKTEDTENSILTMDNCGENSNLINMNECTEEMIKRLAEYMEIEKMLLQKCENIEPNELEHHYADKFTMCIEPYRPLSESNGVNNISSSSSSSSSLNLCTAIALINKYCAKLPSDTFTKLTPLWRCARTKRNNCDMYQYTIRFPINSPLKDDIYGLPMPTRILARRVAAQIACQILHKSGELDDSLQPIGKEGFRATEPEWEQQFELDKNDEDLLFDTNEPRPGTTKRRQYYYKRIASVFSDCRPTLTTSAYLYLIKMTLECPIPEEQNTRGRKIYPPEESPQSFGILTTKKIPKISSFPIFTRSGEVKVSLELKMTNVYITQKQLENINIFLNYTFTKVLRLQKYMMLFDPDAVDNSFFIVPTITNPTKNDADVDWQFLELIANNCNRMPVPVSNYIRRRTPFDASLFKDAVVMPWYRNQDQPQYFYVAEICTHLSPESSFPGDNYKTFREYYHRKYDIHIQNHRQPLLDVDHTSARLNFLTPRYVNRKGVALPTSSEETKRAKRENLEQKQILVPELCTIHPFPASLWRAAVCLPCILYRINALLLADEIRKQVSHDVGLGTRQIESDIRFEWPMLNFGWSLAEVLRKSREAKQDKKQHQHQNAGDQTDGIGGGDTNLTNHQHDVIKNDQKNDETKIDNDKQPLKKTANDLIDEGDKKMKPNEMEIGTWSNEMANNINENDSMDDSDEEFGPLPANINLITNNKSNIRYGSPTSWMSNSVSSSNQMHSTKYTNGGNHNNRNDKHFNLSSNTPASSGGAGGYFSDSDYSYQSDDDFDDMHSLMGSDDSNIAGDESTKKTLKIEFKSDNVAEAIESEEDILKRQRQLEIINNINANEKSYQNTKNIGTGYDRLNDYDDGFRQAIEKYRIEFDTSIMRFENHIKSSGMLVRYNEPVIIKRKLSNENILMECDEELSSNNYVEHEYLLKLLPFLNLTDISDYFLSKKELKIPKTISIDDLYKLHQLYFRANTMERYVIEGTGDLFDQFNDLNSVQHQNYQKHKKILNLNSNEFFKNKILKRVRNNIVPNLSDITEHCYVYTNDKENCDNNEKLTFSFDEQPDLDCHPGPSPSIILQALTMSNANDGINLERLETIGDSFLKYAITTYMYCTYEDVHEGKLSHLRSKQVSNLNLYRLGRKKMFGESMIATKFEPHDNWLPPCYYVPKELEKALIEAKIPASQWNLVDLPNIKTLSAEEICKLVKEKAESLGLMSTDDDGGDEIHVEIDDTTQKQPPNDYFSTSDQTVDHFSCFIPYNLVTQHSIPDKSIADCVEALIGAYLIECGQRGALLFMAWLGIRVLPYNESPVTDHMGEKRITGSTLPYAKKDNSIKYNGEPHSNNELYVTTYGHWAAPKSPLLHHGCNPMAQLEQLLDGYSVFEDTIGYHFRDRSYLLQAMTHASYSTNRLTDCYQRLEFLGDAVLDYLITRHLYEDPRQHSPGALTDLRSALVNNTIFASLAVRHGFHKYFRHMSPGLNEVIGRFVRIQHENGHSISEEFYLISEEECDEAEDVEVPKALGDVFESIAGAIFLDSNMSLDTVWRIYSNMMRPEIEQFSNSVPKSPIRELLELEPETAKFSKPEKLADGRRVRVSVEVFGKGTFRGIGRNYRIAKCTAAKCALRQLKKQGLIKKHK